MYIGNSIVNEAPNDIIIDNIVARNMSNNGIIAYTSIYTDGSIEKLNTNCSDEEIKQINKYIKSQIKKSTIIDDIQTEKLQVQNFTYIIVITMIREIKEYKGQYIEIDTIKDGKIYVPNRNDKINVLTAQYEALNISRNHEWFEDPDNYQTIKEFENRKQPQETKGYTFLLQK